MCKGFFFLLRSVGRRDLSAGPEQKKKTPPRVFFFVLRPRGKAREGEAPLEAGTGPEQKKNTTQGVFFFAAAPPGPGWCFFFLLWPRPDGHSLTVGWGDFGKARVVFFFLLRPRRVFLDNSKKCLGYYIGSKKTRRGHSFPCLSPGPEQKKKTPWVVFFFCSGPVPASNGASPSLAFRRGRSKKKNTLGGVFFFAAAPRGRSLTHCGPGWRCLPLAGAVFFFCCGPARTGVVFFFCCGPARTLTHSRWAGAISARPGWCFFFLLRPRRVFLENSKKCLGYYIGSKKTRRGHSKKKKHHFQRVP